MVSNTVEVLLQPLTLCCSLLGVGGVLPAVCNALQLFLVDSTAASLASSLVSHLLVDKAQLATRTRELGRFACELRLSQTGIEEASRLSVCLSPDNCSWGRW